MKIYTKTGDDGTTSLFGGKRLAKSDPLVTAYGTVDELTSFIGLLIEKVFSSDKQFLTGVQNDLYVIMSLLSGSPVENNLLEQKIKKIEERIDEMEKKLPRLTLFILPQGSESSAFAHVTRTICRRAEREVVKANCLSIIIRYLNRLSDFFFVLARSYNKKEAFARK